jgi:L-lactate dehydrogenase complex protein LldG
MMKIPIEHLERMEKELQALRVKTYRGANPQAVCDTVASIVEAHPAGLIGFENRPLLRSLDLEKRLSQKGRTLLTMDAPDRRTTLQEDSWGVLRKLDIGIGLADYALADTGTLVLFSGESSGRWASLAPTVHIALLPAERILPSLESLFPLWGPEEKLPDLGSAVIFMTGPSRTADIELKLVLGAHGPKELHVITLMF